ncbi:hypothetical protein F5884DRAFT_858348 [Xylogone sp. PMI_703]|nr:hypothetical protein F5884DRAFT_858348 [Xylogone sp. PMI_703]
MAQSTKTWADGPMKLVPTPQFTTGKTDGITLMATEMACVHNCLMRCINNIYLQAPHVPPSDYKAFLEMCSLWHGLLKKHHDSEEQGFFNDMNQYFGVETMVSSITEHAAFHDGIGTFSAYIKSLSGKEAEFNGTKLVEIIDSFVKPLEMHFHNEIDIMMGLSELGNPELVVKMWTDSVNKAIKEMKLRDVLDQFPFTTLCHDYTFENGLHSNFPPAPRPVLYIFKQFFLLRYRGLSRYTPCDVSGTPQPLHCPPPTA